MHRWSGQSGFFNVNPRLLKIGDGALRIATSVILGIIILMLTLSSVAPDSSANTGNVTSSPVTGSINSFQTSYVLHSPIIIVDNSGFLASGFSGYGNATHPYVLDGVNITFDGDCITISNVSAHFLIRDCLLTSSSIVDDHGIFLRNVTHGTVELCVVFSKRIGVELRESADCRLHNNTFRWNSDQGVHVQESSNCTLINNIVHNNSGISWAGICIGASNNCTLIGNTIYYGQHHGVWLINSSSCELTNNTIHENAYDGMYISDNSVMCVLTNNTIYGNGGHGIHLNSSSGGILIDNSIYRNSYDGVFLNFSPNCLLSTNIVFENPNNGIHLVHSNNGTLMENIVHDNFEGIYFTGSPNTLLWNNSIYSNSYLGVHVGSSDNSTLSSNTIHTCVEGVHHVASSHCTLVNNTITNINTGVHIHMVYNITLTHNIIFGSSDRGIILAFSYNGTLTLNEITEGFIGVSVEEDSSGNTLSRNTIGWNSGGNALDNGISNNWDDRVSVGNSWGDYNGTGTYSIPGSAGSVDNYPVRADTIPPTCDEPEDFEVEAGTTGISVTWKPSDDHPKSYLVLRNGTYFDSGVWDDSNIEASLDGFGLGTYNLTLVAFDTCFNSVSDTVLVTVVDTCGPLCNNPSDMQLSEGTTGNTIIWTPWDATPSSYRVLRNGTEVDSGVWSGSAIVVSLDGLSLGVYNYTISLSDLVGHSARDTVIVIVLDATTPTIDRPIDIIYEVGVTGNVIVWHPFDLHPASYGILRNGSTVRSGGWDGSAITIVVDGLATGAYNFTVTVRDVQGNWVSGTVFVTVIAAPFTPMTVAIAAGSVGLIAFLALVVVVKRKRKPKVALPAPGLERAVETKVQALRGCEIVGGKFEYKVKVQNNSNWVITNVSVVIVAYPDDCLQLAGSTMKRIPRIEPAGFRSPQFTFTPTKDCVEGQVLATVTYVDYENRTNMIEVEPYVIRSVCDLLKPRKASLEEFDLMLDDMVAAGEQHTLNWNPEVLFVKLQVLLPAKNFYIIDSTRETTDATFKGTIQGLAEGKYTGKKVAVRITVSGIADGNESDIGIEGLGDDEAMLPTTIHELSEGLASWICLNCGAALNPTEVSQLGQRIPIECRYCGHTITIDLYRR